MNKEEQKHRVSLEWSSVLDYVISNLLNGSLDISNLEYAKTLYLNGVLTTLELSTIAGYMSDENQVLMDCLAIYPNRELVISSTTTDYTIPLVSRAKSVDEIDIAILDNGGFYTCPRFLEELGFWYDEDRKLYVSLTEFQNIVVFPDKDIRTVTVVSKENPNTILNNKEKIQCVSGGHVYLDVNVKLDNDYLYITG